MRYILLLLILSFSCKPKLESKQSSGYICIANSVAVKQGNRWKEYLTPHHLNTTDYFAELTRAGYQVEYNYKAQVFGFQDGGHGLATSWDDQDIKATDVWTTYNKTGSFDEKVAVLDTGIDYNHVDLDSNIPSNIRDQSTTVIWDTVNEDNNPYDDNGHGTHVAGIIGGEHTINGTSDSKGINNSVTLLPVKVMDSNGSGTYTWIADGIYEAINQGAHVLNMSFGAYSPPSNILIDAIRTAMNSGVIVVAAAGNAAFNNDKYASYPANTKLEGVISVASHNSSSLESFFTNFGSIAVHLSAPGQSIESTLPGNSYTTLSGTSMAAPQISGAIALLRQIGKDEGGEYVSNPLNTGILARTALLESVQNIGWRNITGGKANLLQAVQLIKGNSLYAAPTKARVEVGRSFRLVATNGTPPYTFSYLSGDAIGDFKNSLNVIDDTQTDVNDAAWFTATSKGFMTYLVTDSLGQTFEGSLDSRDAGNEIYYGDCEIQ